MLVQMAIAACYTYSLFVSTGIPIGTYNAPTNYDGVYNIHDIYPGTTVTLMWYPITREYSRKTHETIQVDPWDVQQGDAPEYTIGDGYD